MHIKNGRLHSKVNGRSYGIGKLELVSLKDLRKRLPRSNQAQRCTFKEIVDEAGRLHRDKENAGALFQVASQFNLLEMAGPSITPENGVTRYQFDHTQGPACAISAGAATIYRNYFVPVGDQVGQRADIQLNLLDDFEHELTELIGTTEHSALRIRNGYALPSLNFMRTANSKISAMNEAEQSLLRSKIKIGLHWDVEVTSSNYNPRPFVSQAFCAAMPISYSQGTYKDWGELAKIVLDAAYEATLYAAVINSLRGNSSVVFLTSLGGGAFGNPSVWIEKAIKRSLQLVDRFYLDVKLVLR